MKPGDIFAITAAVLHGPCDILVTTFYYEHEANSIVLQLGLERWLVAKAVLLVGFLVALRLAHEHPATLLPLAALTALGVLFILPGLFIAIA